MPQIDRCHEQVENALKKEGWLIKYPTRFLAMGHRALIIDIEAVRQNNGAPQQILLAEVKCFGRNTTVELYIAIGQYIIYQAALLERGENIPLYLAIPKTIYDTLFENVVRRAIRTHQIKLLVVNIETEEIVEWIE